jgi:hypothetical protein
MIQRKEIKSSLALSLLHLIWPNKNFIMLGKEFINKHQNDPN